MAERLNLSEAEVVDRVGLDDLNQEELDELSIGIAVMETQDPPTSKGPVEGDVGTNDSRGSDCGISWIYIDDVGAQLYKLDTGFSIVGKAIGYSWRARVQGRDGLESMASLVWRTGVSRLVGNYRV